MNKKGFTLIELIASVTILATIALLAFPAVLNMLNNGQKEVDSAVKQTIESAAKEYYNDNNFMNSKTIDVCTLVQKGYLSNSFYQQYKDDIDKHQVVVTNNQNNFTYNYQKGGNASNCISE